MESVSYLVKYECSGRIWR